MKRSKMIEYIEDELIDFVTSYNLSSDAAKPYKRHYAAAGLLAMIEGFGMLPPENKNNIPYTIFKEKLKEIFCWEPENE
jgi:hypothetical protein